MALIPICTGLCSSTEGLCESCQHCKTTASLEGEGEDVQTSSRELSAVSVSKTLGMLLLSLYSPWEQNHWGSVSPEPTSPCELRASCPVEGPLH